MAPGGVCSGSAARGVGWLFGADADAGKALVAYGVAAAPERVDLRVEYATALHATGRTDSALEELAVALALPARTALDRHHHARAGALRTEWE